MTDTPQEIENQKALKEILEIVQSIYKLATQSKKSKTLFYFFVVLELWVHSLLFQHISELKNLKQLIPFLQ